MEKLMLLEAMDFVQSSQNKWTWAYASSLPKLAQHMPSIEGGPPRIAVYLEVAR